MPTCSTERTRITCAVVLSPPSISTARHQLPGNFVHVSSFARRFRDRRFAHFVVQAVGAEHQHVAWLQVSAVVSGETNISGPRERIRTWRASESAISRGGDQPILRCSLTSVWSCVTCLAFPLRTR
jgi:hypothetical protein